MNLVKLLYLFTKPLCPNKKENLYHKHTKYYECIH